MILENEFSGRVSVVAGEINKRSFDVRVVDVRNLGTYTSSDICLPMIGRTCSFWHISVRFEVDFQNIWNIFYASRWNAFAFSCVVSISHASLTGCLFVRLFIVSFIIYLIHKSPLSKCSH